MFEQVGVTGRHCVLYLLSLSSAQRFRKMVNRCKKCQGSGNGGLFSMPIDPSVRLEWCLRLALNVRTADQSPRSTVICADHFEPTDITHSSNRFHLRPGAVPKAEVTAEQMARMRSLYRRTYPERNQLFPARHVAGHLEHIVAEVATSVAWTSPSTASLQSPQKRQIDYKDSPDSTPAKKTHSDLSSSNVHSQPDAGGTSSGTTSDESTPISQSAGAEELDDELITEVCLVYTDQLENLLRAKCLTALCNSIVDQLTWIRHGSCLIAKMECINGHHNNWSTQPPAIVGCADTMHRGNLDLTTATVAAGLAYADIQRIAEVLDLAIMSKRTFFDNQSNYVMPTIDEVYQQHMDKVHEVLVEEEQEHGALNYAADAQCDSPGYCANLCCESFLEISTGLIASMTVVHKSEPPTKTSQAMEPFGFKRCLDELISVRNRKIGAIVTDNHSAINLIMRRDYAHLLHQLDKWHVGKNLKKRLFAVAKTKSFAQLRPWIRSILNHLWFAVENCQKDAIRCQELLLSITFHISNQHTWNDPAFSIITQCAHDTLTDEKVASTGWLVRDTDVWRKLFGILNDKRFLRNVSRIAHNLTTSAVENYHSVRLLYATKRKAFRYAGYRMRSQLAVLHHNYATMGKEPVLTAGGKPLKKIAFSKPTDRWTEKTLNIRPGVEWKRGLLLDVRIERLRYVQTGIFKTLSFPNIPANAAPLPRPIDERMEALFESEAEEDFSDESENDE